MIRRAAAAGFLVAAFAAGCSRPLPEEGSPDALLYADKCNGCHRVFHPSTLTPKMWQVQVDRMDTKYGEVGKLPPTADERARILAYLTRHAQK